MHCKPKRFYGAGDLYSITCSCHLRRRISTRLAFGKAPSRKAREGGTPSWAYLMFKASCSLMWATCPEFIDWGVIGVGW